MYIRKIEIKNIRSISSFEMDFPEGKEAGWHVLIGENGAGKSTIVKSMALSILAHDEVIATRENWNTWLRQGTSTGNIAVTILKHDSDKHYKNRTDSNKLKLKKLSFTKEGPDGKVNLNKDQNLTVNLSTWKDGFSVAFGPFRRFSGGDREKEKRIYENIPKLGAHLSIFGEDIALSEAIPFLRELYIKKLENRPEGRFLDQILQFINHGELLPQGVKIDKVDSDNVYCTDGYGKSVSLMQMSDGFKSILSLTFEMIRQMRDQIGLDDISQNLQKNKYYFDLPGVVLIDEIDAHLHPTWQTKIGQWFTRYFPKIQFVVTTHSPLICRACENGSIWRLAAPGGDQKTGEIKGEDKDKLIYGDVLDAYETDVFGDQITRGKEGRQKQQEYRSLVYKENYGLNMTEEEKKTLKHLKSIFHTDVATED